MKNHALHHLQKTQEHHEAMAKVHRDAAAEHAKLVDKARADDVHHNLSSLHKLAQEQHETMASHCEDLQKAIRAGADGGSTDGVTVDTSVPTNANSFGGHQFSAAALADELAKRWGLSPGGAMPMNILATAPNDDSARKTGGVRLPIGRDGKPVQKEEELGKAAKDVVPELAHWFE